MPGGPSTGPRSGGKATLDAAAFGWLRAGAVWPPLLPRDHPPRPAPAQAVMEEGAQAARSRREHANPWGLLRGCCGYPFVIGRAEAAITLAEGVLKRAVQHGGANV